MLTPEQIAVVYVAGVVLVSFWQGADGLPCYGDKWIALLWPVVAGAILLAGAVALAGWLLTSVPSQIGLALRNHLKGQNDGE